MNPEELLRLLQQFQASQQAQAPVQAQAAPSQPPQRSIMDILGGDTTPPEGSSIFAYSGGEPFNMENSNERIRMILESLQAGEAPGAADPLLGEQVRKDFTPINPQPGQTFRLKGYQDEGFGFNPQTGAFTNIGVPKAPGTKLVPEAQPQVDPKAIARHAEIVRTLTKNGYSSTQAGQIADQVVPGMADIAKKAKQEERLQGKEDTADIQRRNLREKFVMENQSNLFKRGTGESFLGQGKPPENTEQILKDYAVLKPENAKDMRSLDMVGGYVDGFRNLMTEIKPLLSSQKRGVAGRIGAGTEITYLRAKGDARVRKMDALAAQITLLAKGFGGDARVSDKEMERLDNSIINGWTTKEGADSTIGILDDFITNRSNSLGFPKYKTIGQRPKKLGQPIETSTVLRNKDKKGRPIISRDNGLNWEYE